MAHLRRGAAAMVLMVGLLASRPVLEGHVRRRLLALPSVMPALSRARMASALNVDLDECGSVLRKLIATIDDIVDYLTFVFVPVVLVARNGQLPDGWLGLISQGGVAGNATATTTIEYHFMAGAPEAFFS